MSLWQKIENAEHSTCVWLEKEWIKLNKDLPTIEKMVDQIIPYANLMIQTVLDAAGQTELSPVVGVVLKKAQTDLTVVSAVVADTGVTPTAKSALAAVQNNLSGILAASQISDAKSVATVTKVSSELGLLAAAVSAAPVVAPAPSPAA